MSIWGILGLLAWTILVAVLCFLAGAVFQVFALSRDGLQVTRRGDHWWLSPSLERTMTGYLLHDYEANAESVGDQYYQKDTTE